MTMPILYSLRQCPYAMRSRLGILHAQQTVVLRDIDMKNKPEEMLSISPKGTVPVLQLSDGKVIDESLDVMVWALTQSDPNNLFYSHDKQKLPQMLELIHRSDHEFVDALQKYRAASRYHDSNKEECRERCCEWLMEIEHVLTQHAYIMGEKVSLVDYAILPFIRQFSRVDKKWYAQAPLPYLRAWLVNHYNDPTFSKAMFTYPKWHKDADDIIFGDF
ncbi:glutathione S-transferase [Aliivibrio finisterrensis]|uniref:Glutathione S-transferase n=1 Tax=Aliivibrio finisterrensis TaxID=511998 RepID=A0A4Q5KLY7_9GAMM|nr:MULTISPECIES: glutathione S-transferase [Aliivibrio]MDD9173902.1 glutathione S-transferase [Aliivibrio sp. S3TY1]MDD9190979.1 glutathione S-transferase [Aliivibrio sp. S2TY2]RYU46394.1 glutathione S-transferase [Aliivibrio finisterrensis]